jgi:hypothetical protein
MSEDSRKYLYMRRRIELKKLYRQLVDEEELERKEAARTKSAGGATSGAEAVDPPDAADHGEQVDRIHEDHQGGERGNDDEEGNPNEDLMQSPMCQSIDLWNSQVDAVKDVDAETCLSM